MKRHSRTLCLGVLTCALLGCASKPPFSEGQQDAASSRYSVLSGRLSVVVAGDATDSSNPTPAHSISAAFELHGSPQDGGLNLISPLGSMIAQARWSPQQARLVSSKGERIYPNIETLTREMLGESLPVDALFDWLRGQPWPQASSTLNTFPAPSGFTQLGWRIDLSRFSQSIVMAERERAPKVTLRARLDMP